jgi:molybdopterin converting factor small subunit
MTKTIDLRLFATLQQFEPPSARAYPIEKEMTARTLVEQLGIPEIKAKLIFINGIKRDLDSVLKDGDRVGIFPPVGGG